MSRLPVRIYRRYAAMGRDPEEAGAILERLEAGSGELIEREVLSAQRADNEHKKSRGLARSRKIQEHFARQPPQAAREISSIEERGGAVGGSRIVKKKWRTVVDRGPTFRTAEERRAGFNERKKRWRKGRKGRKI